MIQSLPPNLLSLFPEMPVPVAPRSLPGDLPWQREAQHWLRAVSGAMNIAFRLASSDGTLAGEGCRFCRTFWRISSGQDRCRAYGCIQAHAGLHRLAMAAGRPVTRVCYGGAKLCVVPVSIGSSNCGVIECGPFVKADAPVADGGPFLPPLTGGESQALSDERAILPVLDGCRTAALADLLGCMARGIAAAAETVTPPVGPCGPPAIVEARRYISEHIAEEDLTLGRVACHVELNEDYVSKLFQRVTGLTFTDYLNRLRLDRVCYLLTTTSMGVAEAAMACGFGSVPHFNRVFRQYLSMSPTAFRRAALERSVVIPNQR